MKKTNTYLYFGLLDFLAYYVPGVITILFLLALQYAFNLAIKVPEFEKIGTFIGGAIWTILSLIIPYVIGHIVFPFGYFLGKCFFKSQTPFNLKEGAAECEYLKGGKYCPMESIVFAGCIKECLELDITGFNELMITRFRTLSRFCRSMLLPVFFLAASFILWGIYNWEYGTIKGSVVLVAVGVLTCVAFWGFGRRYKKYEIRWRNAVCIGSKHFEIKDAEQTPPPSPPNAPDSKKWLLGRKKV